jgi:hypothetical protein
MAAIAFVVLLCAVVAAVFVFRGKIFKSDGGQTSRTASGVAPAKNQPPPQPQPPAPPPVVVPPANDTNWMLNLDAVTIPDSPAAGRIHGQNFNCDRAILRGGMLTLCEGLSDPVTLGVQINFGGAQPKALADQSLNIATNAPMAARLIMIWQDGGRTANESLKGGYAMRINFGQASGKRISGQIYFCAPDEMKSYILGTFNAEIQKNK